MGLDMYLHGGRSLTPEEVPVARGALALLPPEGLIVSRDPDEDGDIYISGWEFSRDPAFAPLAQLLEPMKTDPGSPSLYVKVDAEGEPVSLRGNAGYWRKTNAVHRFFVEHAQGGEDDCGEYDVDRGVLRELLTRCLRVLERAELVPGIVRSDVTIGATGATLVGEDPEGKPDEQAALTSAIAAGFGIDPDDASGGYAEGRVLADPSLAEELLPTQAGFFFGDTGYDEWYARDLADTALICARALDLPDGFTFTYRASW